MLRKSSSRGRTSKSRPYRISYTASDVKCFGSLAGGQQANVGGPQIADLGSISPSDYASVCHGAASTSHSGSNSQSGEGPGSLLQCSRNPSHLVSPNPLKPVFLETAVFLKRLSLPEVGEVSNAAAAFLAAGLDRLVQSGEPAPVSDLLIGEGLGQTSCYASPAVPRGQVQGRVTLVVDRVNVQTVAEQDGYFLDPALRCCLW